MKDLKYTLLAIVLVASVVNGNKQISAPANDVHEDIAIWDMFPLVSQLKSGFQMLTGDVDGATNTQRNFLNDGVGPSQVRSVVYLVTGEPKRALDVQTKFVVNMGKVAEGVPIVGYTKGVVHLITGDGNAGWNAIKSATSSTGAVVGALGGGPIGAVGGHLLVDALITTVDYAIHGEQAKAHGFLDYLKNINHLDSGNHFDAIAELTMPGFLHAAAMISESICNDPKYSTKSKTV